MDVVLQTILILSGFDAFRRQGVFAGAYRIKLLDELQHYFCSVDRGVGAIILRTVTDDVPSLEDTREVFVFYDNRGIGLVVFQKYVISWTVSFDKIVL